MERIIWVGKLRRIRRKRSNILSHNYITGEHVLFSFKEKFETKERKEGDKIESKAKIIGFDGPLPFFAFRMMIGGKRGPGNIQPPKFHWGPINLSRTYTRGRIIQDAWPGRLTKSCSKGWALARDSFAFSVEWFKCPQGLLQSEWLCVRNNTRRNHGGFPL